MFKIILLISLCTLATLAGHSEFNPHTWNPERQREEVAKWQFLNFLKTGPSQTTEYYPDPELYQILSSSVQKSMSDIYQPWVDLNQLQNSFHPLTTSNPTYTSSSYYPVTLQNSDKQKEDSMIRQLILHPSLHGTLNGLVFFLGYRTAQKLNKMTNEQPPQEQDNISGWLQEFLSLSPPNVVQSKEISPQEKIVQPPKDNLKDYTKNVFKMSETFLKENPYIQSYITSSMTLKDTNGQLELQPFINSNINLTTFRDEVPKPKNKGYKGSSKYYKIHCGESVKVKRHSDSSTPRSCQNAIGLAVTPPLSSENGYSRNRTTIYFDLKDGEDFAVGRPGYQNIFIVQKGVKYYKGQENEDTFILTESGVTGNLDGGEGDSNTLVLKPSFDENEIVILNFTRNTGQINQSDLSLLSIQNIQIVHGREGQVDKIIVDPSSDIRFIDGHGGVSSDEQDFIEIIDQNFGTTSKRGRSSSFNLQLVVRPLTKIQNLATNGNFTYIFQPSNSTGIDLQIDQFNPNSTHQIQFNWTLAQISSLNFQPYNYFSGILTIQTEFGFSHAFPLIIQSYENNYTQQPKFVTTLPGGFFPEAEIRINPSGEVEVIHHLDLPLSIRMSNETSHENHSCVKYGLSSVKNVFNLYSGHWHVLGGQSSNIFVLHSNFTGHLDGNSESENFLILELNFLPQILILDINLPGKYLAYKNPENSNTESSKIVEVGLENIQSVIGRPNKADVITLDCRTTFVDGRGGAQQQTQVSFNSTQNSTESRKVADVIQIPPNNKNCPFYKASIIIHPATVVQNAATQGEFTYHIRKLGFFDVQTGSNGNLTNRSIHNYILPYNFDQVKSIIFDKVSQRVNLKYKIFFSRQRHYDQSHKLQFSDQQEYHTAPNILTNDGVQFKMTRDGRIMALTELEFSPNFLQVFEGMNGIQHTIKLTNLGSFLGTTEIRGGDQNDLFILDKTLHKNNSLTGKIVVNGQGGQNELQIFDSFLPGENLRVNLFRRRIFSKNPKFDVQIFNFTHVQGRPSGNETIVVNCHTKFVDGMGGHDLIIVPPGIISSCKNRTGEIEMTIVIRGQFGQLGTRILNFAPSGVYIYQIEGVRSFNVGKMDYWREVGTARHIYQLGFKLDSIDKAWFEEDWEENEEKERKGKIYLRVKNNNHVVKYKVKLNGFESEEFFKTRPKLLTRDGLRIVINKRSGAIEYKKENLR